MSSSVLRILDANLNRAREALRVVEDYARFALNDDRLSGDLKRLRHDLQVATARVAAEAILHRDTPGDVGTTVKTDSEQYRDDLAHVVTAAGKRLGEALRAVEECLKSLDPAAAGAVERCRYAFYDSEQRVARTLRPAAVVERLARARLYVLITEAHCAGRDWLDVAARAVAGGADCLQLREKDLDSGELLRRARAMVELCRTRAVVSVVNDRPDIAVLSGADGVHVGQTDLPAAEARRVVGHERIVGVSTHTLAQARQARLDGADYIGVGPVFPSSTKPRALLPGLSFAREAARELPIPAVAIAGITEDNAAAVAATGVRAIAVTAAVCGAADVAAAAARLKAAMGG